ncbi:HypC/HybG/HupF family hydrogenase formation chaperone [Ferrimonas marina]|uniref:Hydrogenase expression/formation protein HypC n=1 Tax=Ferrimonas marina TaxID=299255 RepID=A0A1M5VFN2_9GAMM|nr:HypC/HybG/HupF family hydrogenase formation chaperone [Ferrimonas marina]SHH74046.1 hydrogenase expression/formation protein HypC [Ferrimonas marina]
MCLGIPAQIQSIDDAERQTVTVAVNGVQRQVNAACIWPAEPEQLLGQWAVIHVGFALGLLSEAEAEATLAALKAVGGLEHELADLAGPEGTA